MKHVCIFILIAFFLVSCGQSKVKFEVFTSQKIIPVLIGKDQNVILQIRINIEENKEATLQRLNFSTKGATDWQDIELATVFYTGQSDVFKDSVLFGNVLPCASTYTFKAAQTLQSGDNYFWVSIKLKPKANILHKIVFTCSKVTVNNVSRVPNLLTSGALRIGHDLRNKGDDGSEAYRIPGLVTTSKGTLVAVYDIRWRNSRDLQDDIDIGASRSLDKGQSWLPMQKIIDMGEWGGLPQNQNGIGDPSILVDEKTGRIWVAAIWAHGGKPGVHFWSNISGPGLTPTETGQLILAYSDDDGVTWSAPINITPQVKKPEWFICLQGPGMGITLKDGTLVFPAQFKDKDNVPFSTIIFSKDRGQSWQIGAGARSNTTEAQVVELEPGVLMLNMRDNRGGSRAVSITRDMGSTWEEHPSSRSALREPVCMASLIKFEASRNCFGKDILLFSNPNSEKGRNNMTIKASLDGGLTWPEKYQLLLDEGNGWGYSCLTMIDRETVGIFYEGSGSHICFQAIPLEEIIQ